MKEKYTIRVHAELKPVLKAVADLLNDYPETASHVVGITSHLASDSLRKRLRAEGAA